MALATPAVSAFAVYEPRMKLGNERHFAILRGGNQITPYKINPSSGTNTNLTFSTNPPSNHTILDRVAILKSTWQFEFTQSIVGATLDGQGPVLPEYDAPRAWPVSSVTTQLNCAINGFGDSIQLSQMIHALTRFDSDTIKRNGFASLALAMDDNVQDYRCGLGLNTNVLNPFGNNTANPSRGQYFWKWVVGPVNQSSATPTAASGTIEVDLYEYVVLPPFIWDGCEAGGLTHINQLQFTWTFGNNLQRMWSRCPYMVGNSLLNSLTSLNVNYQSAELQLFYITPRLTDVIPDEIIYPYYNVVNYRTNPVQNAPLLPGDSLSNVATNNLQLQAIPSKIIIYVKQSDSVLNAGFTAATPAGQASIMQPDCFARIDGINVTWNNNAGLFSSATSAQLWEISVQNGLTMSWPDWYGVTNPLGLSAGGTQCAGTGSIICLMPGKDLNLSDIEAPGMVGQYNLQIQVSFTNIKPSWQVLTPPAVNPVEYNTLTPEINVTCIYPGIMTIKDNQCSAQVGIISREQALTAPIHYDTDWNELVNLYGGRNGGNFFDGLKTFGKKALNAIRTYAPAVLKGVETVAPLLGLGANQGSALAAGSIGYQAASGKGGVLVGGKSVDRKKLKDRLAKY